MRYLFNNININIRDICFFFSAGDTKDPRKASFIVLEDLSLEDGPYVEQLSKETLGQCLDPRIPRTQ